MRNNIEALKQNVIKAEAFIAKWGEKLEASHSVFINISDITVSIYANKKDAPLMGTVFGKAGWKRKIQTYGGASFDWKREVDGVMITIDGAEDCNLNDSPVPEKAFPILLN